MPQQTPTLTLKEVAARMNADVIGNGDIPVNQVVHPRMIQSPQDLVLAIEPEVVVALNQSPAKGVVQAAVVAEGISVPEGLFQGYIVAKRPKYLLAQLLDIFDKPAHKTQGIHPTAVIHPSATVPASASIGPLAVVCENAVLGENVTLMSHVTVGAEAVIGEGSFLHAGTRIGERVILGKRVLIHPNACIGADGFSFVTPEAGSIESAKASGGTIESFNTEIIRINSVGTVILEDDVEIGACATIDRATLGATLIKRGTKIDNLVMIGHNNTIGQNCLIVSQVGVSGSCNIGDRVVLAGQSGIKDHVKVGSDAIVMAKSGVMWDVPEKSIVAGAPAQPQREVFQTVAYIGKLKEMYKEIQTLKKQVSELQKTGAPV